jgi:hypothetical protein
MATGNGHYYFHGKGWERSYTPEGWDGDDAPRTEVEMGVELYPQAPVALDTWEGWQARLRQEGSAIAVFDTERRAVDGWEAVALSDLPPEVRDYLMLPAGEGRMSGEYDPGWLAALEPDEGHGLVAAEHMPLEGAHEAKVRFMVAVKRETDVLRPALAGTYWIFDNDSVCEGRPYGAVIELPDADDPDDVWESWWVALRVQLDEAAEEAQDHGVLTCSECGYHHFADVACGCTDEAEDGERPQSEIAPSFHREGEGA